MALILTENVAIFGPAHSHCTFTPSDKLLDYLNVVGMLRNLLEGKGQGRGVTVDVAVREVSKEVLAKWFHDTVYHKSLNTICKMVGKVHSTYIEGKRRLGQGKLESDDISSWLSCTRKRGSRRGLLSVRRNGAGSG